MKEGNYAEGNHVLTWCLDSSCLKTDQLAQKFTWAQWDCDNQALYYIHMKPKAKSTSLTDNDEVNDEKRGEDSMCPTLSALQFHDELPTETVVKIF